MELNEVSLIQIIIASSTQQDINLVLNFNDACDIIT